MRLITVDMYSTYIEAILIEYGIFVNPIQTGKRGRPSKPFWEIPQDLIYVMLKKNLSKDRIVTIETELVFGTDIELSRALKTSKENNRSIHHLLDCRMKQIEIETPEKLKKNFCFSKKPEDLKEMALF